MTSPVRAEHPLWNRTLAAQLLLYLGVGFFASVLDVGGFSLLHGAGLPFLVAAPASFLTGTLFNYVASYLLAFERGRFGRGEEIARMAVVVVIGAALNTGFAALFMGLGLAGAWAKLAAIPCVFAWNFLARRWLVFHARLPAASERTLDRLLRQRAERQAADPPGP